MQVHKLTLFGHWYYISPVASYIKSNRGVHFKNRTIFSEFILVLDLTLMSQVSLIVSLTDWQNTVNNLEEDNSGAWWSSQTSFVYPSVADVNHVLEFTIWNFSIISENISFLVFEIKRFKEIIDNFSISIANWVIRITIEDKTEG